ENERGVYHIDGNPDDATTASEKDVLKSMLASDPDTVQSFFSRLSNNLYDKLNVLMKSTQYSSVYTVYEDKRMKTEYSDYDKKIAEAEEKLKDLEDRYYKQFSAMETALGSMNSQSSYFSSLLG
ncbi:MAG: flagellar filament capping protein FliD, partial [Lachnospiraceae bacterium]|nr:flagellar filament capping protein FliD [Lachnospiraceae bacterium]